MEAFLQYLTLPFLLEGLWLTLRIFVASMVGGLTIGLLIALMRLSPYRLFSALAWAYVWLLRGTPVLLQLVFLFDALPLIGIVMPAITTAIIGFSLNEAAFAGEIIRGGILSVNRNQTLAAASLGMGPLLTLRRIVLPQAMRAILPAVGNDAISVLKGTSLASVIAVNELTLRSQQIVAQNFKFFPVFAAAGVMYLTVTTLITGIQFLLERRVSPDVDRSQKPRSESALARLFGFRWRLPEGRPAPAAGAGTSVHAAAPAHRPPRADGPRRDHGGRRARGLRARGRRAPALAPRRARAGPRPDRHGLPAVQPLRAPDRAREHLRGAGAGARGASRPGPRAGHHAARKRGARPPRRSPALAALRRAAAAGRHRARARHLAAGHALRRADLRARPGAGVGGALGDPETSGGGHDHDRGDPRAALRPRGGRPHRLHGRRPHRGGGHARAGPRAPARGPHPAVPEARPGLARPRRRRAGQRVGAGGGGPGGAGGGGGGGGGPVGGAGIRAGALPGALAGGPTQRNTSA